MPAVFNSKQFEWSNIEIVVLGRSIQGVVAIEWTTKKDKEYTYGRGNNPRSIQHGRKSYEGSITLLQSEVEALEEAARIVNPTFDITDIEFDIAISFADGVRIRRHIVQTVSITEVPKAIGSDDKFMEIELPFMALGIAADV